MSSTTNFGTDLSCIDDLTDAMLETSGRILLGQAIARRLITPRGGLIDDPNYGFDVRDYLNDDIGPGDLARLQAGVNAEAVKDERVIRCTSKATFASGVLVLDLALVDSDGPFKLVLAVSDVTVQLLKAA